MSTPHDTQYLAPSGQSHRPASDAPAVIATLLVTIPPADPHADADALRRYGGPLSAVPNPDAQISIEVRLALMRACPSLAFAVEITTTDAVVHLRGSVPSDLILVRMYKAARTVPGIHWICNDVTVARQALAAVQLTPSPGHDNGNTAASAASASAP